jgi:hypothetical protein
MPGQDTGASTHNRSIRCTLIIRTFERPYSTAKQTKHRITAINEQPEHINGGVDMHRTVVLGTSAMAEGHASYSCAGDICNGGRICIVQLCWGHLQWRKDNIKTHIKRIIYGNVDQQELNCDRTKYWLTLSDSQSVCCISYNCLHYQTVGPCAAYHITAYIIRQSVRVLHIT